MKKIFGFNIFTNKDVNDMNDNFNKLLTKYNSLSKEFDSLIEKHNEFTEWASSLQLKVIELDNDVTKLKKVKK